MAKALKACLQDLDRKRFRINSKVLLLIKMHLEIYIKTNFIGAFDIFCILDYIVLNFLSTTGAIFLSFSISSLNCSGYRD